MECFILRTPGTQRARDESDPPSSGDQHGRRQERHRLPGSRSINLGEDYEVRDWAESLGVSGERLREAVATVGNSANKVRE
ncbi:DUF3606 domain-containing protein [Sphingomonas sp. DT-207]|uniref:DUF3606 domain-containing protein n=1 Tax=Sphingomonas sp. DT-207 TaxID=3396167 RepID=UPI003F1DE31B